MEKKKDTEMSPLEKALEEERIEEAKYNYRRKKLEEQHWQENLSQSDKYNIDGVKFSNKDDYANAIENFNKALKLEPGHEQAKRNLSIVYFNRGAYLKEKDLNNEALSDLKKSLELGEDSHSIHFFLGSIYSKKQLYSEAINEYKKAIEILPEDPQYHFFLGFVLYMKAKEDNDLDLYIKSFEELYKAFLLKPDEQIYFKNIYLPIEGFGKLIISMKDKLSSDVVDEITRIFEQKKLEDLESLDDILEWFNRIKNIIKKDYT